MRSAPHRASHRPERILGIRSNFLGSPVQASTWKRARVAVLPVPYERTVSYGTGTASGPGAILRASAYVEFYDEETGRDVNREVGIATLPPLSLRGAAERAAVAAIEKRAGRILDAGKFLITLGGEHSISLGLIRAHLARRPNLSVLQIDAHSDLRESYQGTPYSHACVMARVCEDLDPRRLVQVGIRAQSEEEAAFIRRRGITTLYAHMIRRSSPRKWMDRALSKLTRDVYVSFDVDGLDPSIMPSTGTPEPNGLLWEETTAFLRRVGRERNVVGCDVVEFSPLKGLHHADLAAAKLVSKMINYFVPQD